jgi:hypothetical protein
MTATKVQTHGKSEKRTVLLHEREEIGMVENAEGHCTVFNEIKIANVFGQYTSLLTGISVTFPCNPDVFEEEALQFHGRTTKAIMDFQNRTLEAVGKEKMWHGKIPAPAKGSGKKVGVKTSSGKGGAAKKKAAPAARKRVPRKK